LKAKSTIQAYNKTKDDLKKIKKKEEVIVNKISPRNSHKTTASFIPSLCPSMKHLTKFDAIYHQKPPEKKISKRKAGEIGQRLHSSRSNKGRSHERK